MPKAITPQARKPINIGNTESTTKLPINALIGTAMTVAIHPVIAAPTPLDSRK
jgi:hypothetical protein